MGKFCARSKRRLICRLQSSESDGNFLHGYNRSIDPLAEKGCKSQRYERGYEEMTICNNDRSFAYGMFLFDSIIMYSLDLNLFVDVV